MSERRHASVKGSITQNPEQSTRGSPVHGSTFERRRFAHSLAVRSMAGRALSGEQLCACSLRLYAPLKWIDKFCSPSRSLLDRTCRSHPASHREEQPKRDALQFYHNVPPRNRLRIVRPNCAISYDTPKRNKNRALVLVNPKTGETLKVGPFASVQAAVGAT